ncbi:MAG: exodeoxyribonuclease III [Bdellovibrionota bacterium]
MKLVTWNVNGLRSVHTKGFFDFIDQAKSDIICLQEIKVSPEFLKEPLKHPKGYHSYWNPAEKLGYSGVAVYSKKEPLSIKKGLGEKIIDSEGRVLTLEYPDFVLVNAYFPNSQRDHVRLPYKLDFNRRMHKHLDALKEKGKNILLCGDFNVAHKEIDLKNPKTNTKNAGFLPEERAWMDQFLASGYTDTFRHFEKGGDQYTWWSYRPGVREKNIGWRLDYFVSNEEYQSRLKAAEHLCSVKGSDHCPVLLTLKR